MRVFAVFFTLFLFIAPLFSGTVQAEVRTLNIGIFWKEEPQSVLFVAEQGDYELYVNGSKLRDIGQGNILKLKAQNGTVQVRNLAELIGTYTKVELKKKRWGCSFKIKPTLPSRPQRTYYDNLTVRAFGNKLRTINNVFIEHYVAGVVESEAGTKEPLEYYKVQAVICRTYALNNLRRHEGEGFQLCDKVHCQVYHSRSTGNPDIVEGVKQSIGIVVVDSDINLITAAFSSNCGGETCNSEDVWTNAVTYLRAREDTSCRRHNHSYWHQQINRDKWLSYLKKKFNYPIEDSVYREKALFFCNDDRQFVLTPEFPHVELKTIRRDWRFSSAFFDIETVGDTVYFQGRGYGHGVGLCQEGAMNMAYNGVLYKDILHYYYKDVHLINISVIDFFRAE